jgi:bifunctional non-homologous end joining protein LigD
MIAEAGRRLNADHVMLDGEIIALDPSGRSSFQALQHRGLHPGHSIVFYAFDVLLLGGQNLIHEPLTQRRARLPEIVGAGVVIRVLPELPGRANDIVQAVRALGLEGVIAKRKSSVYQPGKRSGDWVKLKLETQQEFVIGGYRPVGDREFDALLVGYYKDDALLFAGKVRAGLVPHVRRDIVVKLKPLRISRCPFANLPDAKSSRWGGGVTPEQMREFQWVRPELVAQIRFVEWTAENRLRHAAFLGLRIDKSGSEVRRES